MTVPDWVFLPARPDRGGPSRVLSIPFAGTAHMIMLLLSLLFLERLCFSGSSACRAHVVLRRVFYSLYRLIRLCVCDIVSQP